MDHCRTNLTGANSKIVEERVRVRERERERERERVRGGRERGEWIGKQRNCNKRTKECIKTRILALTSNNERTKQMRIEKIFFECCSQYYLDPKNK